MSDLLKWLIQFSIIGTWLKRLNTREIHKGLMMIAALSTQRPERGGQPLQAKLAMVDLKAHRYPDQPRMPCVDRRALEERLWWDSALYRQPGDWRRECPRHLRSRPPWPWMVS